ncbi:hypothetical protein HWV62_15255 [Athelia sp. TMB]|nr:hypothetical protein HWV62_15255 [Athelia sp. TMB]
MSSDATNLKPSISSTFYIETVTFLVENELFKVPKFYFEKESSVFRDMFTMPSPDGQEGDSDELPIVLQSIKKADFTALLAAILGEQGTNPIRMEAKEWAAVLQLATLWEFGKLRLTAIKEVRKMESISLAKVVLGRNYHVRSLLKAGYAELIAREERLSDQEKKQLGDKVCIKVYEAREMALRTEYGDIGYNLINGRNLASMKKLVEDGFEAELRDAQREGDEVEMEVDQAKRPNPLTEIHRKRARRSIA